MALKPQAVFIDTGNGWITVVSPYVPEFVNDIKQIPSHERVWDYDRKVWKIKKNHRSLLRSIAERHYDIYDNQPESSTGYDAGYQDGINRGRSEAPEKVVYRDKERIVYRDREKIVYRDRVVYKDSPIRAAPGRANPDHELLCVTPGAPKEVIDYAYKIQAKLHHPDKGGSTAKMAAINTAYERIKK